MPKATNAIAVPRNGRKAGTPFSLNIEARAFLRAHAEHQAAEKAFRAAAAAEKAAGRDTERNDYTAATVKLRDKWHASMREMSAMGDAIAKRSATKRQFNLSDCLLLALASWHSGKAHTQCSFAVLSVAGIDMAEHSK